ncbi:MAG: aminotransferase class V-fold PLP-dependent enzyme [Bacteroidia bacterium]|nr:aminotransferase class V-fold PLP-dependent enzyme [Bacteroidia bacterium]
MSEPLQPSALANELLFDETFFKTLRQKEYAILDEQNQVYLDYTGGNLYPASLINKHHQMLLGNVLGNPHSTNPTSQKATQLVEDARKKILEYFNAQDYYCVFTQNASGALKIVGESYPFTEKSTFVLLSDNHNSVNGIREFCVNKKGKSNYVPVQYEDLQINHQRLEQIINETPTSNANLFAFPAQSNVSGVKHNLSWIKYAQNKGFDVLLDAAAFVPSSKLDLSIHTPDYVSMSFYKIFGYPTGIGCLLIKKSAYHKLIKPWFAGGTVTLVSVVSQNKFLAEGHERFEDGTLNFNNIPAIKTGLEYIESIGIDRISKRVNSLAHYLYNELKKLKHSNGNPIVKIFGPETFENRGGSLIMNFFDANGKIIPFQRIENQCNQKMISIRSGCFCNPGIDEINNHITEGQLSDYFLSRDKGDYYDMIAYLGTMRGASRISVGLASNKADLDAFIEIVNTLKNQTI